MYPFLSIAGLTLLLLASPLFAQPQTSPTLKFAPIPMSNPEHMTRVYLPFLTYLEQQTGHPFELSYYASYADLLEAFANNQVDVAYLGPLPYVVLNARSDAVEPLVQLLDADGQSDYTCAVVRFAATPETTAPPQRVALTQPLSTCGYLAMEHHFHREGTTLESDTVQYAYTGSHEQVALEVILNHYDLGGMKTQIAQRYQHLGLRVVAETPAVPGFILVANRNTLPPAISRKIRTSLLQLQPLENEQDRDTVRGWSRNLSFGARPVDPEAYNRIHHQWQRLNIDLLGAAHE